MPAPRQGWRTIAGAAILLGVAQFAGVWIAAMWLYPGGSDFNLQAKGYSFWQNTMCDLGKPQAANGQINPMSLAFSSSLGGLFAALVITWISLPCILPSAGKLGRLIAALGILSGLAGSLIGVSLVVESYIGHIGSIGVAAIAGLTALVLACIAFLRGQAWGMGILSVALLGIGVVHFGQYIATFWLGHPWTPAYSATQKIAILTGLCWFVAVAVGALRSAKMSPKPERGSTP